MLKAQGLDENLRFLILEVSKQLDKTRLYLEEPNKKLADRIHGSNDYIDNLKRIIQHKCFMLAGDDALQSSVDVLEATHVITANLERIADFCENIVDQLAYVENDDLLEEQDFDLFLDEVASGVSRVENAFLERDVELALRVCRAEDNLDLLYGKTFAECMERMKKGKDTQSLVTILFMSHYFERMGDCLLNVGEAIISYCLGEKIKIGQFRALRDSLEQAEVMHSINDLHIQAMGETRSGCRIDRVYPRGGGPDERAVIFKEGRTKKLQEELDSIEMWNQVMPDLVPKVHSFHQKGEFSAILFEHLEGRTFDELLARGSIAEVDGALSSLLRTLEKSWTGTRKDGPCSADLMGQLLKRINDVYTVHPRYAHASGGIGPIDTEPLERLARRAKALETRLQAPFSVFIHGDFNIDNIIFDEIDKSIRFIDLHRSRDTDYVQDASVFIVSNYRLQGLDTSGRQRVTNVILRFFDFVQSFAAANYDDTMQARLALGVARSFATSTRFVLDKGFARDMFLRSRYLLERVLAHDPDDLGTFRLYTEALVD
jgi:phosphate uptake regulator/aminoglycoside phosphotransferase (APT) family kinase protein